MDRELQHGEIHKQVRSHFREKERERERTHASVEGETMRIHEKKKKE